MINCQVTGFLLKSSYAENRVFPRSFETSIQRTTQTYSKIHSICWIQATEFFLSHILSLNFPISFILSAGVGLWISWIGDWITHQLWDCQGFYPDGRTALSDGTLSWSAKEEKEEFHNFITQASGLISPSDSLYLISRSNFILDCFCRSYFTRSHYYAKRLT